MALGCQEAWKGSSGIADDAWDETNPSVANFSTTLSSVAPINESTEFAVTSRTTSSPVNSLFIPKQSKGYAVPAKGVKSFFTRGVQSLPPSGSSTLDCPSPMHVAAGSRGKFLDLPPVLILEIFKHLDARELSIVSCVCTLFRRLASDNHGWKDFYCERWGLPVTSASTGVSPAFPEQAWKDLYVAREVRSKAFMGRFLVDMMHGHTAAVRCVRLLPQANLVFTAGYDSILRVWDLEEGLPVTWSRPLGCTIRGIAVDMEILVLAGTDAQVRVWHAVSDLPYLFNISSITGATSEVVLSGHTGPITCLGLDGVRIYSGSWDMTVKIWDRSSLVCIKTLMHMDWVWALVPRGHKLVSTAGSDVYSWDVETGELVRLRTEVHVGQAYAVECSRSGHFVFTGGEDGAIRMFDDRVPRKRVVNVRSESSVVNETVAHWKPHSEAVYSLAFEDPWLVSASGDGSLAMMDVRKMMKKCHSNGKSALIMGPNNWHHASQVVTSTDAEPPHRMLTGFHHSLYAVDVGADRVVGAGEEKVIRVWDFSQAFEIERRVQASRTVRLEQRLRRKQAAKKYKGKQPDSCNLVAKRDVGGGLVWQRRGEGSRVRA